MESQVEVDVASEPEVQRANLVSQMEQHCKAGQRPALED